MIDFQDSFWAKDYLLYDSRRLISGKDTLFFAFRGRHQDGHKFIAEMYEKGVRNFVVRELPEEAKQQMSEAAFQVVENPLRCMQQLANFHRNQFTLPVIGITGSNGKTIVKEWLYSMLSSDFRIVKSPKSYNSQIGVPLSVWELNKYHNLAIFEAGISKINEMAALEEIIQPKIGIFTNIGAAHDEGFTEITDKINEKLKLFKNSEILIYNTDNSLLANEINSLKNIELYSWGKSADSVWQVAHQQSSFQQTKVVLVHTGNRAKKYFFLPFTDAASIENALNCIVLMLYFEIDENLIQQKINTLHNLPMRLELKEGQQGTQIIDDTYSNDISS